MAHILIVEDETRIADFLDRGLRAAGHVTSTASDGHTGLHLALGGDVDLVVLDPPREGAKRRVVEQVVDTAWRGMAGTAPSLVDGRANSLLAVAASRFLPTRLALRTAERMMRHKS